jgi:hypothetical protein
MNRSYNSKKLLQRKKRNKKIKIWCFSILILVLIVGFFYWMRHSSLNVEKIRVVKNTFSKSEKLEASVSQALDGNVFLLIPKTNAFLLPRHEAEVKLKEEYPEIEKIDIDLKGLKEIEVEIFEYEPVLILAREDPASTSSGMTRQGYFVNKEGNVFLEEPVLHSHDSLLEYKNENEVSVGDNVIDKGFLGNLNKFVEKLKELEINVSQFSNPEEEVFRLETDKTFEIVISLNDDLDSAFENVKTILENGALKKEDLDLVDYIDLRFGNKVFYKLKE